MIGLNNVLSGLIDKSIPTGSLLIYYDFYSGSGNYIDNYGSLDCGSILYGDTETFFQETEVGTFMGGISGYEHFLEIQNPEYIWEQPNLSIFFQSSQFTKRTEGLGVGPLNENQVIFSCLTRDENCVDGFEISLTAANLLNIEFGKNFQSYNMTYEGDSFGENLWGVGVYDDSIIIGRFSPVINTFESKRIDYDGANFSGQLMNVGSGYYPNSAWSTGNTFCGTLKSFGIIGEKLSSQEWQNLFIDMLSTYSISTASTVAYTGYDSFSIDRFSNGTTSIDVLNSGSSGTGYSSGTYFYYDELTGVIPISNLYYTRYQSVSGLGYSYLDGPIYTYRQIYKTGAETTGITGLSLNSGTYTFSEVYITPSASTVSEGFSGISGSGTVPSSALFGLSDSIVSNSSNSQYSIYPSNYIYLGEIDDDFVEIISTIGITGGEYIVKKTAAIIPSAIKSGYAAEMDYPYNTGSVFIFSNGSGLSEGPYSSTETLTQIIQTESGNYIIVSCSGSETIAYSDRWTNYSIDGTEYSFTGDVALFDNIVQPRSNLIARFDDVIYDVYQSGTRGFLTISSTGDYLNAPFSEIDPSHQVFFNNVKIYSGVDYIDNGGFFPSGSITGSVGEYFSIPNFISQSSSTGASYSVLDTLVSPNSYVTFINGLRDWKYYYYGSNGDMVTESWVQDSINSKVY